MPPNIANYYRSSGGKQFLIMGRADFVEVYDRNGSPWTRLNGQPHQIGDLENALRLILADGKTKKQITPRPNLYPLHVGTPDDVVMIQIADWEKFHQVAQDYLKQD